MRLQLTSAVLAMALFAVSARADEDPTPPPPAATNVDEAARADATPTPPPSTRNIDVTASSEVSGYADTNHVFVVSPTIAGTVANPTAGWSANGRYLVDVVSAASVDIVATASRRWHELRHVGTLGGTYKPDTFGVSATADISVEPDYTSLTLGGVATKDIFDKNATLLVGYDHRHDIAGRSTTPFSVFARVIDHDGFKAGASLVLDRSTIVSLLGDFMLENGDTSKPYRYVPMFAPGTLVARGASIDVVNSLRLSARPLEQLPLSRTRYAGSARLARRWDWGTFRLDERVYTDSWGLKATTTDARLLFDLGRRVETGPHLRFHAQSAVDFWQRAYELRPGFDLPALRTGDRELGPLVGATGGATLRIFLGAPEHPRSWSLGLDIAVENTRYLDTLFITSRLSSVGALSLETEL